MLQPERFNLDNTIIVTVTREQVRVEARCRGPGGGGGAGPARECHQHSTRDKQRSPSRRWNYSKALLEPFFSLVALTALAPYHATGKLLHFTHRA